MPRNQVQTGNDQAAVVLTRATLRAAELLGVNQKELGAILGTSGAGMSRLAHGQRQIEPSSKEGELAILFVRIFRSLDALVGGDTAAARSWLRSDNRHLEAVPLDSMKQVRGLVDVAGYLDAIRGKA